MPSAGLASGSVILPGDSSKVLAGDGTWVAGGGGSGPPTGASMFWPFGTVPSGWLLMDGSAVSRTTYATLFALWGTQFGAGDGSTTFNLPNITGRVLVAQDVAQTEFDTVGEVGGAKTVAAVGTVSQPTFAGSALGTHAHGVGSYLPSAHSGTAVAAHASHTHTYSQVPNHVHPLATGTGSTGNFSQVVGTVDTSSGGTGGAPTQTALGTLSGNPSGGVSQGTSDGPNASLTHAVTQPDNHTMAGSSEAVSAGTPAGTVSQPTFTGTPTSVLPPYFVGAGWIVKT